MKFQLLKIIFVSTINRVTSYPAPNINFGCDNSVHKTSLHHHSVHEKMLMRKKEFERMGGDGRNFGIFMENDEINVTKDEVTRDEVDSWRGNNFANSLPSFIHRH